MERMAEMKKPVVIEKMHHYIRAVRKNGNSVGKIPRSMALDYNNVCNFKCEFCYEQEEKKYNKERLPFEVIERIADEAHELGIWEIVLQGGEQRIMAFIFYLLCHMGYGKIIIWMRRISRYLAKSERIINVLLIPGIFMTERKDNRVLGCKSFVHNTFGRCAAMPVY